jgi:uracil phosphoribosyltransferase
MATIARTELAPLIVYGDMSGGGSPGIGDQLLQLVKEFSKPGIDRGAAQYVIARMTQVILHARFAAIASRSILLLPVLRAGAAMWPAANSWFGNPASAFAVATKTKATNNVAVAFSTLPRLGHPEIVVLDTVAATGDTMIAVAEQLAARFPSSTLHLVICYASPEAVHAIERFARVRSITVGVVGLSVDADGFVLPKINGDAGEKLFGVRA